MLDGFHAVRLIPTQNASILQILNWYELSFGEPMPNCVYAIHDYSNFGFPRGERHQGGLYEVRPAI